MNPYNTLQDYINAVGRGETQYNVTFANTLAAKEPQTPTPSAQAEASPPVSPVSDAEPQSPPDGGVYDTPQGASTDGGDGSTYGDYGGDPTMGSNDGYFSGNQAGGDAYEFPTMQNQGGGSIDLGTYGNGYGGGGGYSGGGYSASGGDPWQQYMQLFQNPQSNPYGVSPSDFGGGGAGVGINGQAMGQSRAGAPGYAFGSGGTTASASYGNGAGQPLGAQYSLPSNTGSITSNVSPNNNSASNYIKNTDPYSGGAGSLPQFQTMAGFQAGGNGAPPTQMQQLYQNFLQNPGDVMGNNPAYQAIRDQALQAAERAQLARGGNGGGTMAAELAKVGGTVAANFMPTLSSMYQGGADQALKQWQVPNQQNIQAGQLANNMYQTTAQDQLQRAQGYMGGLSNTQASAASQPVYQTMLMNMMNQQPRY